VQPFTSVAVTLNAYDPGVRGVPERRPPEVRRSPVGRDPVVTANVYGEVPPVAVMDWLYAVPCVPAGREAGFTEIEAQLIVTM
jgi:hypothetical protein